MHQKLFSADTGVFLVLVDPIWSFVCDPEYFEVMDKYVDSIRTKEYVRCFLCNCKIGPRYRTIADIVVVGNVDEALIFSICPKCSDQSQRVYDKIQRFPGVRLLGEIHPHVGYA